MPALLCSAPLAEPLAHTILPTDSSLCKKQQPSLGLELGLGDNNNNNRGNNSFDIPEICDQIARHLDRHTLTVVVRVSSHWYAHWIRHLWRRVRVESGTVADKSREMLQVLPQLSQHIRHLEWIHLTSASSSSSSSTPGSILDSIDLSNLNAETILLSSWTNELDAVTLSRFTQSSAHRLSALQMYNMAQIRGDLLKVAGTLPQLRHFTLSLADQDSRRHKHNRQRSNAASVGSLALASALPSDSEEEGTGEAELVQQVTSADSLPDLMDACPQLRMIEILDLPLPTPGASTTAVVISENQEDQEDQEDQDDVGEENQYQDHELEVPTLSENVAPNWVLMQHLTTINLHATAISGSTLTALFARTPQLVKLNLGQNTPLYLSDFHLDPSLCMIQLSTLILSGCHFIDGHGYKEIFKASPNLLHLDIPQTNVDDAALAVLGHQCLGLTDLNLDGCLQITDQGIRDMLSHPRPNSSSSSSANNNNNNNNNSEDELVQERYENRRLQCLSVSNCTELTGQGIHHILMTCGRLRSLEFQQPEIMPESLFPHTLETDDDDDQQQQENPSAPSTTTTTIAQEEEQEQDESTTVAATVYPLPEVAVDTTTTLPTPSVSWACHGSLELLRIKNLNTINTSQTHFLNARLRELSNLKALHIGGSQLELSILNGLGHQLENLYIDDLAREVDVNDVRWLVDHTPNLTRLWCRQLIRHSEPWKMLRAARTHLKLW